jgi:hypothetical protein
MAPDSKLATLIEGVCDSTDNLEYGWGLCSQRPTGYGKQEGLNLTSDRKIRWTARSYAFHPVLKPKSRFTLNGLQHGIPNVSHTSGTLRF